MEKTHVPRRTAAVLLLAALLLAGLIVSRAGAATAADEQEKELLGTLSKKYEASSPGTISSGNGDAGGKSYGSYQFSSASDIPKSFFEWCQASKDTYYQSIGDRLSEAYYSGGAGYGSAFDSVWKTLAKENAAGFEQAQRNYVRLRYYDPIVRRVEKDFPGFDIDNYSIALRNVLWSRAVQLGVGGAASMMDYAMNILGGFANQPEAEIIRAIYADCAEVRDPKNSSEAVMSGTTAEKYGVDGKVLSWFSGSSSDVQLGVYVRLAINEPAQAQQMLATYGYEDAPLDEGIYQFSPAGSSGLSMTSMGARALLSTPSEDPAQQFRLTYYASGYYIITNEATGQRLTAGADGTVTFTDPGTDTAQMWKLEACNSGFSVKNRSTDLYLSIPGPAAGGEVTSAAEPCQWQIAKGSAAWSLDGGVYPTYASMLREGSSSYPFVGTLRCSYPIQTVKVQVLTASGSNAFTPATAGSVHAKLYDLSRLNSKVSFSKLGAGAYTLVITATSSDPSGTDFRLESPFYVSDGEYMVYFDACGGTVNKSFLEVSAGQTYGELPEASRPGYIFMGWYTAPEDGKKVDASGIATASNTVLYARYEKAVSYTFRNHDGTTFVYGELLPGDVIPLPTEIPPRMADQDHYYVFIGWDGFTEGMTISNDVVFEARFEARANELLPGISSDTYDITGNILHAVSTGTTLGQLHENLIVGDQVVLHGSASATTTLVGTGMTVVYSAEGQPPQTLTVVVTGDTSGDGQCTVTDMVQLQSHLLGRSTLSDAALQAADLNGDGSVTITDMVQITSALLGRSDIQPG